MNSNNLSNNLSNNANIYETQQGAMSVRPEGAFTSRIHGLADNAESTRDALHRLLNHLRVGPPVGIEPDGKANRQVCVEDHLSRAESANKSTSDLLNELAGLFQ